MTDDVRPKNITLTPELLERLRAERVNASQLIETLLRQHFKMTPRPEVEIHGRWKPGETRSRAACRLRVESIEHVEALRQAWLAAEEAADKAKQEAADARGAHGEDSPEADRATKREKRKVRADRNAWTAYNKARTAAEKGEDTKA